MSFGKIKKAVAAVVVPPTVALFQTIGPDLKVWAAAILTSALGGLSVYKVRNAQ